MYPADFFCLRTPAFPAPWFENWADATRSTALLHGIPSPDREASTHEYCRDLRSALEEHPSYEYFKAAIAVASESLWLRMNERGAAQSSQTALKCNVAVCQYFSRICSRATPFGLFANVMTGRFGGSNNLVVQGHAATRRHVRIDADHVFAVCDALLSNEAFRREMQYVANSSLYRLGPYFKYFEQARKDNTNHYKQNRVLRDEFLDTVLEKVAESPATFAQLTEILSDEAPADTSIEELVTYLDELIASQLIVPSRFPLITGGDPFGSLVDEVTRFWPASHFTPVLREAQAAVAQLSHTAASDLAPEIQKIGMTLGNLLGGKKIAQPVQIDSYGTSSNLELSNEVKQDIAHHARLYARLTGRTNRVLSDFKRKFVLRYEDREVRLVEALDPEIGLAFLGDEQPFADLLAGVPFLRESFSVDGKLENPLEALLMRKLARFLQIGDEEITISDEDISFVPEENTESFPHSFHLALTLLKNHNTDSGLDQNAYEYQFHHMGGTTAGAWLGRFAVGDELLYQGLKDVLHSEASCRPNVTFAEIVHVPEERVTNILVRRGVYDYEIPFCGVASVPTEQQIRIEDLFISVKGGRFVLRSARLNREIVPRLNSAHNFWSKCLATYRFLCLLQYQGRDDFGFNWPQPFLNLEYLPRVRLCRAIISPAKWRIPQSTFATALAATELFAMWKSVEDFRVNRKIPRFAAFVDGDNVLKVDFLNPLSVASLVRVAKGRDVVELQEVIQSNSNRVCDSADGQMCHEIVMPFTSFSNRRSDQTVASDTYSEPERDVADLATTMIATDRFAPGSEWLYLKLYCGHMQVDLVLVDRLQNMLTELSESGELLKWFFVRYGDPDWHIRLRIQSRCGDGSRLLKRIRTALNDLETQKFIWNLELDTYRREHGRYGGSAGMDVCEELFWIDSIAQMKLICAIRAAEQIIERWHVGLSLVVAYFDMFQIELAKRTSILEQITSGLLVELGVKKQTMIAIGAKYRKHADNVSRVVLPVMTILPAEVSAVIGELKQAGQTSVGSLRKLAANGGLSIQINEIVPSLIHMSLNRLLDSRARHYELMIYDFLRRYYVSVAKRNAI